MCVNIQKTLVGKEEAREALPEALSTSSEDPECEVAHDSLQY